MKHGKATLVIIGLLSAASIGCYEKEIRGCTDSEATNFNPDANMDDGSCRYVSEDYAGTYTASDTVSYDSSGQTITQIEIGTFSIVSVGLKSVKLNNFRGCTLDGIVTETSLSLTSPGTQCNIGQFVCTRSGNTLHYFFTQGSGVTLTIAGRAVK
jgi:hypothetical protein